MIGLLIVSLVIGTVWTPQTQGKTLEQITKERYGDSVEAAKEATEDLPHGQEVTK